LQIVRTYPTIGGGKTGGGIAYGNILLAAVGGFSNSILTDDRPTQRGSDEN